jgi:hypothetical protein
VEITSKEVLHETRFPRGKHQDYVFFDLGTALGGDASKSTEYTVVLYNVINIRRSRTVEDHQGCGVEFSGPKVWATSTYRSKKAI